MLHKFFHSKGLRLCEPLLFFRGQFVRKRLTIAVVVGVVEQIQLKIVSMP
jgi:hypothetical protein